MTIHTDLPKPLEGARYEIEALLKTFRPAEKFSFATGANIPDDPELLSVSVREGSRFGAALRCETRLGGKALIFDTPAPDEKAALLELATAALYRQLRALTGLRPPWGMLTGIRPVTLLRKNAQRLGSLEAAVSGLIRRADVSPQKARLAALTLRTQAQTLRETPKNAVGVYLSIPFCPSRCRYCSFVSADVARTGGEILEHYLDALIREIGELGAFARQKGFVTDTLYVGGGTPTVLSAPELQKLLESALEAFGAPKREFTVEAGRPDTVTREKLDVMRGLGVSRICVNPQSFCDAALEAAGRPHTAQQTVECFELAWSRGFDNINMDFIAGLPKETPDSFAAGLERAIGLGARGITVHTLAMKKAADFYGSVSAREGAAAARQMTDFAFERLLSAGYAPYYLYRQKNTLGNLENTGYAKKGGISAYNVLMMDDSATILAAGAGAMTKCVGKNNRVERIASAKYPRDYLAGFDELLAAKMTKLRAFDF